MADDGLSAGTVARQLGVAVTTLRTWHQRYGLGPSQHVPGQHRRYSAQDLARLEVMRRLTAEGVVPAEAARWAQRAVDVPDRETVWSARRATIRPRDGGGRAIPVPTAGPAARGLARAAMRLDAAAVCDTIERAIAADGVVAAWDGLLRPVLAGIGERHAATTGLIEVEHLLSRCVSETLSVVTRTATRNRPSGADGLPHRQPPHRQPARILLACADEEQHTLPLEALAAALAQAGVPSRQLGARVPMAALVDAVARTGPAVVVLWSHAPATADPAQLRAVLAGPRRPALLLAAGPGWRAEELPAGVDHPASLAEALALTVAVPGPPEGAPAVPVPVAAERSLRG
ncbi:MerR family transcriptional regulator [Micromonospora sp. NPDC050397]|uniref:MerR family transcriptional regulator n=1 Tax=Micromonospora sp. NPDC050397 TaxID=3364279 RepID=UPI00384A9EBB